MSNDKKPADSYDVAVLGGGLAGFTCALQIKQAVEKLYEVKVRDVRTQTRKGKPRRTRTGYAKTSDWKRAIVVLDENSRIELF